MVYHTLNIFCKNSSEFVYIGIIITIYTTSTTIVKCSEYDIQCIVEVR